MIKGWGRGTILIFSNELGSLRPPFDFLLNGIIFRAGILQIFGKIALYSPFVGFVVVVVLFSFWFCFFTSFVSKQKDSKVSHMLQEILSCTNEIGLIISISSCICQLNLVLFSQPIVMSSFCARKL